MNYKQEQIAGPLHGIPLGIKDIISTDEPNLGPIPCSRPIQGDQGDGPLINAESRSSIHNQNNHHGICDRIPDFDKPFPIPRNPWNTERWTDGSSSGTANGIASGQFLGGLGTDTGGRPTTSCAESLASSKPSG